MANREQPPTPRGWGKIAVVFACGAALFSDGYVNAAAGPARTILRMQYPGSYTTRFGDLFSALVFAGTILGQLTFGYLVDRVGRKPGMIFASAWLALFSLLSGIAYGGRNPQTLWRLLIAYRFLLGIGIGAEYPAGSVAAAENTEDPGVGKKHQQKLLVMATNSMIDLGFVVAYLVPTICLYIFGEDSFDWIWRITLGFGALAPLAVLPFRMSMKEPNLYRSNSMKHVKLSQLPWTLTFKKYWHRLLGVCVAWFIYDWIAYPAGIYSSIIVDAIVPEASLKQTLWWDTVINAFYLPGTIAGFLAIDYLGPKYCMITGFMCQAVIGFGMSGGYDTLLRHPAGWAVLYGIYLSFGEFGPGNCLGLLAAKATGPSAVRGIFYAIAAAVGKIGAFVGTYVYTAIIDDLGGSGTKLGNTGPVYIGSGLCILASIVTFFLIPNISADFMTEEDERYRLYLEQHGFDTSVMGIKPLLEHDAVGRTESAGSPSGIGKELAGDSKME